ncbi:MAG: hypothetical protein ACYTG4_10115, partial [Planctomycetota bacterium]|jgi:hypothetical protein
VGNVVVVKALSEKSVYDKLELDTGRMAHISREDVIVGVLGRRRALKGFVGDLPESIEVGDRLQILNLGGVIGTCVSGNQDLGKPLEVEVLGMAVRDGRPLNIAEGAVEPADALPENMPPVVLVEGTCMASGKTQAACEIVQKLNQRGKRIAALKATGVACQRDVLNMMDHGARWGLSFQDAGLPSTVDRDNLPAVIKGLMGRLAEANPDLIVVELGDGIIGSYGVGSLLADEEIRAAARVHVMCANDLVGAWGAHGWMKKNGLPITVFTGPTTDNSVGVEYIQRELGVDAANARTDGHRLADLVEKALG